MIVAFLGKAGVGKDTAADYLCKKYQFVKVAFADPLKRFCKEVFGFTDEQLWGPSSERNKPDFRYPLPGTVGDPEKVRKHLERVRSAYVSEKYWLDATARYFLTPRFALQTLGTEWGRNCYQHVWVDYAMRIAKKLLEDPSFSYSAQDGIHPDMYGDRQGIKGVVISDARFPNELSRIRKQGAKVVQLTRPEIGELTAGIKGHASETDQDTVDPQDIDVVLQVPEGFENYYTALDDLMKKLKGTT